jgi:hypothetical protein
MADTTYPVNLQIERPETSSRMWALFNTFIPIKGITLIINIIVLYIFMIGVAVVFFVSQLIVLFTGKFPEGMHAFMVKLMRWMTGISAFMFGLTDEYPPLNLEEGHNEGGWMNEFSTFRKFITPVVIQVLFWLGVLAVVISGLKTRGSSTSGDLHVLVGFLIIIFGILAVRIYMEILIVVFRLYDSVRHLDEVLTGGSRPAVTPLSTGSSGAGVPAGPAPTAP